MEMMDGAELYDYYKSFSNQEAITFSRYNDELRNCNFDWFDLAAQTGVTQDYNVSLSGGVRPLTGGVVFWAICVAAKVI